MFWLACVWLLPLFTHSGWILFVAAGYALIGGPVYGGGDTIEGCEEFCFLSQRRAQSATWRDWRWAEARCCS